MQQPHLAAPAAPPPQDPSGSGDSTSGEAPPKLVAQAMDRLARAARLIADIRIGADRLLEALFESIGNPHQSNKMADLILKEEANMEHHFQDLRALGRQLEDSGVLTGSLKSRGNSWGLHMPLVCPDGAVVAYAWKRQLAGQAGASAVDRTRLALKAFTDQKRRFFPHLEDEDLGHAHDGGLGVTKKLCKPPGLLVNIRELDEEKSLADILKTLEHELPHLKIFTYQRRDWSKRASLLLSTTNEVSKESSKDQNLSYSNKLSSGSVNATSVNQTAVIELLVTSVFRAVLSLHPAGSINPDAIAFFATDEGGSYIHARGQSIHHVFSHVTEHANKALQYFSSLENNISLYIFLHWVASHHTLFSKPCSKCGRLLVMDKSLAMLLPPVNRLYRETSNKFCPSDSSPGKSMPPDFSVAYHIGCFVVGD